MIKKTVLYKKHLQVNAKMTNFGGWHMPLHYGSQITEHHQVRSDAGMFDVSHMTITDLTGQRVREFLRYLLANDVGRLKKMGQALYSCMLNEAGGILDDLIVYCQEETLFRIVSNAATRSKVVAWITRHAKEFGVKVRERDDLSMLAVQGPHAREKVYSCLPHALQHSAQTLAPFEACWGEDIFVGRTGYTGEDGFELILPHRKITELWENLLGAGVKPIGLGARDTLRLEAGLKLYGVDMDENYTPLESGLGWTVAWSPANRDFIGRGPLEAQREKGEHRIMVGLVLLGKGVLRNNQTVYLKGHQEGRITSGTFSPTLGISIAFSRIPAGKYERIRVVIRNKELPAQVVTPPFVRHGQARIELPKQSSSNNDEDIENE